MSNTSGGVVFSNFTKRYALTKTLRFELKPVGKTRETINSANPNFVYDQAIEDAYQVLKPIFDKLHEEFITKSLEGVKAKEIQIKDYFDLYRKLRMTQDKEEKKKIEKELEVTEKILRKYFEIIYKAEGDEFKNRIGTDEKGKPILKENGYKVLTEAGILKYIKSNIGKFVGMNLKTRDGKKVEKSDLETALGTADFRGVFEGFFTYLTGFNQNRENYYSTENKATSVANRVVDENLPKFCDNALNFEKRKEDYLVAYKFLKEKGIVLKGKNQNGKEKDLEEIITDIFVIDYFSKCLSQAEIEDYNLKIGNANILVNLYNQQQFEKNKKLRPFKTLYKQIGCGEKGEFISVIKDEKELKAVLEEIVRLGANYFGDFDGKIIDKVDTVSEFCEYVRSHEDYVGVFWSDKALNTISGKYFSNWYVLKKALKEGGVFLGKKKDDEDIKIPQAVELRELFNVLDKTENWDDKEVGLFKKSLFELSESNKKDIIEGSSKPSEALLKMIFSDVKKLAQIFIDSKDKILLLNENNYFKPENIKLIKDWLDCLLYTNQIVKYWKVKEKFANGSDSVLSEALAAILFENDNPTKYYDIVRNFLTKKPQDDVLSNKLKLNFDNAVLASGWDVNKEPERWCIILKDSYDKKYLAILTDKTKKFFEKKDDNLVYVADDSGFQKMDYKLLPGPNKMLPKVFISSEKWQQIHAIPQEINEIYAKGSFKKGNSFVKSDLHSLIEYLKDCLSKHEWGDTFKFKFSDTETYESIDQFYSEVEKQGYKLSWSSVNKKLIDEKVEAGEMYLFEIRNKDNQIGKKGISNLHTLYWNAVFDDIGNKPKLNGEAEIFYRSAVKDIQSLGKKKDKKGNEVVNHKRFAEEKFIFHCPITLNFCLKSSKFNDEVNHAFKNRDDVNFIGIDRGEKHLAYYSVVNQEGKIIEQASFNDINGKNYADELEKRAGDRDEARKNWQTIGTIKELKDGYISQVVRKIVDLAVKYNAYIVLENLSGGFKNSRKKIEKSVYQKLELALAKKLNFLVDKKAKDGEFMSVQNALQLTPPVMNFGDIEKSTQFGIMLYTRAAYTSQTDPITGWRKKIHFEKTKQEDLGKEICEKFTDIGFDGKDYYFEYKDVATGKIWRMWSGKNGESLDRYRGHRDLHSEWKVEKYDIVKLLNEVCEGLDKNSSLREQIKNGLDLSKVPKLKFAIDLIQQIRNSGAKGTDGKSTKDDDFILSPVRDENGNHFDSRMVQPGNLLLPVNGDANGAFNIARKGVMMFERIKNKPEKPDLFIKDEDWDAWLACR